MTNPADNSGKYDDADMHSVFSSDGVEVPAELDRLILQAAEEELEQAQHLDNTATGKSKGISRVWVQVFGMAAVLVIAVTLVPLMTTNNELEVDSDATEITSTMSTNTQVETYTLDSDADNEESTFSSEADEVSIVKERNYDAEPVDEAGTIARRVSEPAPQALTLPETAEAEADTDVGGSAGVDLREDSMSAADEQDLSKQIDDAAKSSTASSATVLQQKVDSSKPESSLESSSAQRPMFSANARDRSKESIVNAHSYRKNEKLWIEKIRELHESDEQIQKQIELRFFKLIHPDSKLFETLPKELLESEGEQ